MAAAGIPQYLQTPAGTLFFNTFSADAFYLVQDVEGLDMAALRNAVSDRPQRDGGIIHPFFRGGRDIEISGLIVAESPERMTELQDDLRGLTDSIRNSDGIYGFTPAGQATRVLIVRLNEKIVISADGVGTRKFELSLINDDPTPYAEGGGLPSTVHFFDDPARGSHIIKI